MAVACPSPSQDFSVTDQESVLPSHQRDPNVTRTGLPTSTCVHTKTRRRLTWERAPTLPALRNEKSRPGTAWGRPPPCRAGLTLGTRPLPRTPAPAGGERTRLRAAHGSSPRRVHSRRRPYLLLQPVVVLDDGGHGDVGALHVERDLRRGLLLPQKGTNRCVRPRRSPRSGR